MWLARVRSFIARHRGLYWITVAALALTVAAVLVSQSQRVADERRSWGTSTQVWVAAADTPPGALLIAERREVPLAMVPDHAMTRGWPTGAVARQSITKGEMVVANDIGNGRLALLPSAWRAVAVPADDTTIAVMAGDPVDIVALGQVLAEGVVVAMQPGAVMVGMPAGAAPAVAAATLDRTAVIVLRAG